LISLATIRVLMMKIYINTPQQRYEVVEDLNTHEVASRLRAQSPIKVESMSSTRRFNLIIHSDIEWRIHQYE
jgi:hypothetical protein